MFRIAHWRYVQVLCCLLTVGISLLLFFSYFTSAAWAAGNPQVSITSSIATGVTTGHPGTRVTISGSGFTSGIASLYTTTNSAPAKCSDTGNPSALGLTPFNTHPKVFITGGGFQIQSAWPGNAANPGTSYYICVVKHGSSALSSNTFTVAPPATISVAPSTAAPGTQVTVTGINWLPPQAITISIMAGNNTSQEIASQSASADADGNLNVSLTIPASTQPGTYSVTAVAPNETTMNATASNALIVTATATPSASPSPSVTTSPTVTPTLSASPTTTKNASANDTSGSDGGPASSTILFILIGTGILLVIFGCILFIVYARIR